ncbi:MAG: hypothetical protein A3K19_16195 [Lentisphaerae bacterium RIFOXYB12_FULL_65_16]|nr:MAG: hypothetical protein A3K18_24720 [Lentisphaerae bacterium RIFOXYA12_64_32]OGV92572.1 MAG: hypothetical protein A3K19_16195 [Lentisphaerae bacterium RIFOXYB12_FULL_65_16]
MVLDKTLDPAGAYVATARVTISEQTDGIRSVMWAWYTCFRPSVPPFQDGAGFFPKAPANHALHFIPGYTWAAGNYMVDVIFVITYCDCSTGTGVLKRVKANHASSIQYREIPGSGPKDVPFYEQYWRTPGAETFEWPK